jgi:hypothetical protein
LESDSQEYLYRLVTAIQLNEEFNEAELYEKLANTESVVQDDSININDDSKKSDADQKSANVPAFSLNPELLAKMERNRELAIKRLEAVEISCNLRKRSSWTASYPMKHLEKLKLLKMNCNL